MATATTRFTYTKAELQKAAEALAQNVHAGSDWEELSEGQQGMLEFDAEVVLRAVGGEEA